MTNYLEKAESSAVVKRYSGQGTAIMQKADDLTIASDADAKVAAEIVAECHQAREIIGAELDPIRADANAMHKKLTSLIKKMNDPYDQAEAIAKGKYEGYLIHLSEQGEDLPLSVKSESGGLSATLDTDVEVVDLLKFMASVIKGKAPINTISLDQKAITRWAKDYAITEKQAEAMGCKFKKGFSIRKTKGC